VVAAEIVETVAVAAAVEGDEVAIRYRGQRRIFGNIAPQFCPENASAGLS
jgi:hypothetical protein